MVKNMLLLCLVSAIIIILYVGVQKREFSPSVQETFQENNATTTNNASVNTNAGATAINNTMTECSFKPKGKSLSGCNVMCNESGDNNCTKETCNKICKECQDTDCVWVTDSLKPHKPQISVRPLVNALKVSWKRPKTEYKIIKYTIVLQKTSVNEEKTYYFPISKGKTDINYEIVDLDPKETYVVYAIATNRFGNSPESNRVIVKPLKKAASNNNKGEEKPIHELNFQRGEYEADDLKEVLKKVIDFKEFQDPYHVVARYSNLS